jgi:hypothetical protein
LDGSEHKIVPSLGTSKGKVGSLFDVEESILNRGIPIYLFLKLFHFLNSNSRIFINTSILNIERTMKNLNFFLKI